MDVTEIKNLAREILVNIRNFLGVKFRFISNILYRFNLQESSNFSVDGKTIYYNPFKIIKVFSEEKEEIAILYTHMVLHCLFCHMFVYKKMDSRYSNLAFDIAIQSTIIDINEECLKSKRTTQQKREIDKIKKDINFLSADKIYFYLKENVVDEKELEYLENLFQYDDHTNWYNQPHQINKIKLETEDDKQDIGDNLQNSENKKEQKSIDNQRNGKNTKGNKNTLLSQSDNNFDIDIEELNEKWMDLAKSVKADLETFSKQKGNQAGTLMQNLKAVTREKYDYTEFLKKFAVYNEAMKIDDDEFDYVFYNYGMSLYKNMPLIEPLEYKELKQIKEFVIAIDTSGSVKGDLVQRFLQKTYNILKQSESYAQRVNIHIIQCDTIIQEDIKITSQEEFDKYINTMNLKGFGGTDFRLVFEYVDKMCINKEFSNLKGLIYFTDGMGDYPNKPTKYKTAFVFIDDNYCDIGVPSWATKLVLQSDEV